jgi:hypothetical protein
VVLQTANAMTLGQAPFLTVAAGLGLLGLGTFLGGSKLGALSGIPINDQLRDIININLTRNIVKANLFLTRDSVTRFSTAGHMIHGLEPFRM